MSDFLGGFLGGFLGDFLLAVGMPLAALSLVILVAGVLAPLLLPIGDAVLRGLERLR